MKSDFGFRVRLGNPELDLENLNPDFPIERTLRLVFVDVLFSCFDLLLLLLLEVMLSSRIYLSPY